MISVYVNFVSMTCLQKRGGNTIFKLFTGGAKYEEKNLLHRFGR